MENTKRASLSKVALVLTSLVLFAGCAKKTNSSSKEQPKTADTQTKVPPKKETPETTTSTPPPADEDNDEHQDTSRDTSDSPADGASPAPSAQGSETLKPGARATTPTTSTSSVSVSQVQQQTQKTCPKFGGEITDPELAKLCTQVIETDAIKIEQCLLQKISDLTVLLKTEDGILTNESLTWIKDNSKKDCNMNSELAGNLLTKFNKKLLETTSEVFPESIDLVTKYVNQSAAPTPVKPQTTGEPTIAETTDYNFKTQTHSGSRDFRQKDGSVSYSISKIVSSVTSTRGDLTSSNKNFFGSLAAYTFDFTLKANKTYTLQYKDDAGELTLDYNFVQGSVDGLKKGESARVVLTKASWLKVIEHETQKLLNKFYPNTPRSGMKILLSPLDPPTARTCNIGKGYFLGSHAIECGDPSYSVRIQVLEKTN